MHGRRPSPAMAVDSAAVFEARVRDLRLHDRVDRFRVLGLGTYGNFAFAITSAAGGVVEDTEFVNKVVRPL